MGEWVVVRVGPAVRVEVEVQAEGVKGVQVVEVKEEKVERGGAVGREVKAGEAGEVKTMEGQGKGNDCGCT